MTIPNHSSKTTEAPQPGVLSGPRHVWPASHAIPDPDTVDAMELNWRRGRDGGLDHLTVALAVPGILCRVAHDRRQLLALAVRDLDLKEDCRPLHANGSPLVHSDVTLLGILVDRPPEGYGGRDRLTVMMTIPPLNAAGFAEPSMQTAKHIVALAIHPLERQGPIRSFG